jgi:hypothetical protein
MNNIEVDPDMLDPNDTDYATSGYATDSTSLSSTVNEYIFENGICPAFEIYHTWMLISILQGRRYHSYYGTDKNLMPTDEVCMSGLLGCCVSPLVNHS